MNDEANSTDSGILTCWKDIARYLGKGVRTVQRWERDFGLPVRRPNGADHKSAVAAYTVDLNAWLEADWSLRNQNNHEIFHRTLQDYSIMDDVRKGVATSRSLRAMQNSLLLEVAIELDALAQNCDRLSKQNSLMS
jgi:hypothetical protein